MSGRKTKHILDYFSFHVNLYENPKMFTLMEEYGPLGEAIYFRVLCMIYANDKGYYIYYQDLDQLAIQLAYKLGRWAKKDKVLQVIQFLAKCELLDEGFMRENVLTSRRIQETWLEAMVACKRKIPENREYWLL